MAAYPAAFSSSPAAQRLVNPIPFRTLKLLGRNRRRAGLPPLPSEGCAMPAIHLGEDPPVASTGKAGADTGLAEVAEAVKPRLRGWLHAGMAPLALAAGIVLICLAATPAGVVGGAVFLAASVLLFGTSAVYHRGTWGVRGQAILRRMDHSNIYLFIAATYTPLALILLDGDFASDLAACSSGAPR